MKNSYTAKTLKGLEDILAQELKDLGANNCRIGRRLVHFEGDLEVLYRANLNCRTAITILKPVFSFTFRDEPDFYKKLRAKNWEKYISLEQVFLIRSTVFSDHFNHTKFPALRMKDALADWFVDKYKKRPSVDVDNPSIVFDLHISDNRATVSLDSSGDLLYKRGYRIDGWKAPLNEVLAAGMILLSNWDQKSEFLNPMSGSGTLAIEAAMIAAKIPANYRRATFGFHFWPDFDPFIWRKVFDQSVAQIQNEMESFTKKPDTVKIDYTGQIEEQEKQMAFLMKAFFTGLGLIFFILIFQFNSVSKPGIIMIAIFLSLIGVFGGIVATGSSFVIMMTMMGIISLAGIVVNNGVVLLDYTQLLIDRKKVEHNLDDKAYLENTDLLEAIIKGGKARLRPVLLTAITTILGLIPLATGLNINFFTLFSEFDANVYVGGDNVIFWGPLAWTVIYGLLIATFLTLIVVPILFYLITKFKMRLYKDRVHIKEELIPQEIFNTDKRLDE